VLERAVDAPATGALVDVALDLNLPVRGLVRLGVAPRAVSLISPTRIALPSVSKRLSASSVAQRPTALLASRIAPSISSRLPLSRTVTSTVTSSPELRTTVAIAAPSLALTEGYRILLNVTSCRGRTPAKNTDNFDPIVS